MNCIHMLVRRFLQIISEGLPGLVVVAGSRTFLGCGASVPLVHAFMPATRVVNFKFSYWPSSLYTNNEEDLTLQKKKKTYDFEKDLREACFPSQTLSAQRGGRCVAQAWGTSISRGCPVWRSCRRSVARSCCACSSADAALDEEMLQVGRKR